MKVLPEISGCFLKVKTNKEGIQLEKREKVKKWEEEIVKEGCTWLSVCVCLRPSWTNAPHDTG